MDHFESVTELPGQPISTEQVERLVNRYVWAASYCRGLDVVEAACGAGPGLGVLQGVARSLEAGDISAPILAKATAHYGDRFRITQFDAAQLPFAARSKDVVLLFEAIYYLGDPAAFIAECRRVLRPGGRVLVVTANKDLWDFHPSAYTHRYYGVPDLRDLFGRYGFETEFFGFQSIRHTSLRQKVLRPMKRLAVASGLMPRTMSGKRWLKRIVFGRPTVMPHEITPDMARFDPPVPLDARRADSVHKIIYCAARLSVDR